MEESGHFCLPQYFLFDDAILVPLKVAELILKENKKLSQIIKGIKIYPFEELKFVCPDEIKFRLIDDIAQKFIRKYKKVNSTDGVKVDFDYGWIMIRASNTSPSIRLYVETQDRLQLKKLKEKFSRFLEKEIKKYESSSLSGR